MTNSVKIGNMAGKKMFGTKRSMFDKNSPFSRVLMLQCVILYSAMCSISYSTPLLQVLSSAAPLRLLSSTSVLQLHSTLQPSFFQFFPLSQPRLSVLSSFSVPIVNAFQMKMLDNIDKNDNIDNTGNIDNTDNIDNVDNIATEEKCNFCEFSGNPGSTDGAADGDVAGPEKKTLSIQEKAQKRRKEEIAKLAAVIEEAMNEGSDVMFVKSLYLPFWFYIRPVWFVKFY